MEPANQISNMASQISTQIAPYKGIFGFLVLWSIWQEPGLCERFRFQQPISIFDGYFVLTFNVSEVSTFDIVDAHKTKSLDKKYEEMAPRKDGISIEDVGAIDRREQKLAKKKAQKQ